MSRSRICCAAKVCGHDALWYMRSSAPSCAGKLDLTCQDDLSQEIRMDLTRHDDLPREICIDLCRFLSRVKLIVVLIRKLHFLCSRFPSGFFFELFAVLNWKPVDQKRRRSIWRSVATEIFGIFRFTLELTVDYSRIRPYHQCQLNISSPTSSRLTVLRPTSAADWRVAPSQSASPAESSRVGRPPLASRYSRGAGRQGHQFAPPPTGGAPVAAAASTEAYPQPCQGLTPQR